MVSQLSVDEVADLLKNEGFKENVVKFFVKHEIDGEALLLLEKDHLNRIGSVKLGDILKFEKFISRLRESSTTEDAPALTGPSQTRVSEERQDECPGAAPNPSRRVESSSFDFHDHKPMFHITFNVIVSAQSWGWDDSSELYIILHPPELGGMNDCYRWTTKTRPIGDVFCAVKGTLQMPFEVVQKYGLIYYTYAAKTSQTNGVQNEHLWNVKSRKWNGCRCLEIPFSEKKPGGVWKRWDTIVYPKGTVTDHGVLVTQAGTKAEMVEYFLSVSELFLEDIQTPNNPEDEESVVARCLSIYLHSYKKKLQSCDIVSTTSGISQMVYCVEQIFNQLQHRLIGHVSTSDRTCYSRKEWSSQKLILVMESWTMDIVHTLLTKLDKCTDRRCAAGSFLVSAITVLCIVYKIDALSQLSQQDCCAIACLLRESYRPEKNTCPAYAALEKYLPTTYLRKDVIMPALKDLAVTIIMKSNEKNWQWLYVVPLYHFMAALSSPYHSFSLHGPINWKFWDELESVRKKQQSESYNYILMNVTDLMEMDYMFTKVMLYMSPHKDLYVVLQKVDPIMATSFYIWYIETYEKELLTKGNKDLVTVQLKSMEMAHMKYLNDGRMNQRKYSKLRNNAYLIMGGVLDALTGTSENQCQILHHLIDYVLFITSEKFKKQHGDEATVCLEKLDENDWPAKAVEFIGQWLQKVIGHVEFGGVQLKKFEDEVHVWRVLFMNKDSSWSCTQRFWEYWITAIEQLLERRIKLVKNKAKLVSCLESKRHIPHQVCEVIIRLATDDLIPSTVSDVEVSIKIDNLATQRKYSGSEGKIISRILTRHLEKLTKEKNAVVLKASITVKELVEWKVWSSMLKVASGEQTELFYRMTEFAKEACRIAHNTLLVHCDQVVAGAVTLCDMRILKQNETTVDQLCTAACIRGFSLRKWLGRLEDIERYIERVQQFHNLLDRDVQDYKSLEEELHNVLRKPMKELYFHWNDSHDCDLGYKCCPTIQPCTLAILGSFYLLATTGQTENFHHVWKENMSSLMSRHNYCVFTQEDIVKFVWKPTFEYCVELIARLRGGKTLSEVERIFCNDETLTDLQSSCASVAKSSSISYSVPEHLIFKFCTCDCCTTPEIQQHFISTTSRTIVSSELEWIATVYKRIQHYRLSLECAQAVLTLCDKDHLNLTRKFNSIHGFIETDSKKVTNFYLSDIDSVTDPLLGDLQVLSTISDRTKVQRLQSLINCWKLVEWIKKFQSIDAFYAYVELMALDATDTDTTLLLSDVRTVGNAINKLLFHLPEPCGLNDLVTACDDFCSEESFYQKLLQSQQVIVSLSKQCGQQLETAAIQEVDFLSRKLDHERHQTATMKLEIDSLSATLSQERCQLATVKQEKSNLETISLEQSKQLDIALSKLRDLEQQHAVLQESLHQATEIGRANESMIEKLGKELSTANTETQHYKNNYEQTARELETLRLESTETINKLNTDLEASNRFLEAKSTELNNLEEQFSSVSRTLSCLRKVDNIEGLHQAKEIGRGSYGAVYEVRVNSVPCIAKRVHDILVGRGQEEPVGDEESMAIVRRFHEECDLLSILHHPNVVQFMGVYYGYNEADTSLIMEHMHIDLEHCMKTYPNIPLPYKTSILRDVAYGLAYLHSIPIIHRDLNTGNILLTESLRAKVADLGVSKLFDRKVVHTRTKVPGAMDFMPPECFDESPKYDDKLDIFSFGHLTICLVNQKSPLVADRNITLEDVANGQMQVAKRRESLSRMGGTHPLYSTAVQCLSDNPDRRPTSAVLVEMLEDTCKQYPVAHKNPLDALAAYSARQETNETHHQLQDTGQGIQQRRNPLSHGNAQERPPRIT